MKQCDGDIIIAHIIILKTYLSTHVEYNMRQVDYSNTT